MARIFSKGVLKFLLGVAGTSAVGLVGFDYFLSSKCESVPREKMAKNMFFPSVVSPDDKYVAYVDTYRVRVREASPEKIESLVFGSKLLDSVFYGGQFATETLNYTSNNGQLSRAFKWAWKDPSVVGFFEKIGRYGYPWRMMDGGYHELFVEAGKQDSYVYFLSAHEYKKSTEGRVIPSLSSWLHRMYAKFILWSALQPLVV